MKQLPILLAMLLGSVIALHAQSYSLDSGTISGGGGTSSGGNYSLTGTIAQPNAGLASGGNYALESGFWSVAIALQTPGTPILSITRSGANIIVSWSASTPVTFALEVTGNIKTVNWQPVSQSPVVVGTDNTVTIPVAPGIQFYHLRSP